MPDFYLFGGPNGAGKTTLAMKILPELGCREFVNADAIARALSPFNVESVAFQSGVLMMKRLRELASKNISFGTESTLSARAWVPFIKECRASGYTFNLIYVWLPDPEMNIARVAARVAAGGHDIPEETIRRRYQAGQKNFVELYKPLADTWRIFNNSDFSESLIATGGYQQETNILDDEVWRRIHAGYDGSNG